MNQLEDYPKKRQASIGIRKEADQTVLWSRKSKAFDSRFFLLERQKDLRAGNVEADFTVSDGMITGYVENRLPVTLENAAVYLYGQVLIIGNMEPGQRLEFDREPLKVWPLGMTWMLSDTLTGTPDRQEDSDEEYIKNVQKSNLSGYFTDRYYSSYNGEVRFGAFLPEVMRERRSLRKKLGRKDLLHPEDRLRHGNRWRGLPLRSDPGTIRDLRYRGKLWKFHDPLRDRPGGGGI